MAEAGSRRPASEASAKENIARIAGEDKIPVSTKSYFDLKRDLEKAGLKGFKKGGKVKKTGVYKLHAGEKVVPANRVKQEARDKKILQKTRYR